MHCSTFFSSFSDLFLKVSCCTENNHGFICDDYCSGCCCRNCKRMLYCMQCRKKVLVEEAFRCNCYDGPVITDKQGKKACGICQSNNYGLRCTDCHYENLSIECYKCYRPVSRMNSCKTCNKEQCTCLLCECSIGTQCTICDDKVAYPCECCCKCNNKKEKCTCCKECGKTKHYCSCCKQCKKVLCICCDECDKALCICPRFSSNLSMMTTTTSTFVILTNTTTTTATETNICCKTCGKPYSEFNYPQCYC